MIYEAELGTKSGRGGEDGMMAGWKVKIEDIGPLATVIQPGKQMVKLELEGEQFWMPKKFVEVAEMEEV